MRGLRDSGAGDGVVTGGDPITSCLAGAEEKIAASVLVEAIDIARPIGIETLKE